MTRDELIKRLAAAVAPDRVLDAQIFVAIGDHDFGPLSKGHWEFNAVGDTCFYWAVFDIATKSKPRSFSPPRYTESLDAAITTVPENYSWEVRKSGFGSPAQACLWNPRRSPPASDPGNNWRADHKHGNPAIALCIASLLASAA